MQRFDFQATPIAGLMRVQRRRIEDERGFLCRIYCTELFDSAGCSLPVRQINHTLTRRRGSLRGLHWQRAPQAEIKLVSCLRGDVFDVVVDLRRDSPSFGRWHGERLSADNGAALCIPQGCAHGFQTLLDDCELLYLHSADHAPAAERGLDALDPALGIEWPLPVSFRSARDESLPSLAQAIERGDL